MHTEHAAAKVNLYLHVTGKRDDGYHQLDSLVTFVKPGDELRAWPADKLSLSLSGPFGAALWAEPDNLVLRAARALAEAAGVPPQAQLELEKHLPVASGIGGGSADAAAALRLLQRLWGCAVPAGTLDRIALRLGADVPVCMRGSSTRMQGIGEQLAPSPALPDCALLLVNPGVGISTADVFRARSGAFSAPAVLPDGWADAAAMAATLRELRNDLEAPARALQPVIGEVLAEIAAQPGALLARMSGSGATCFGLFAELPAAQRAAQAVRTRGWWCHAGEVGR